MEVPTNILHRKGHYRAIKERIDSGPCQGRPADRLHEGEAERLWRTRGVSALTYEGYREYLGSFWRADLMQMENHQTGKSTDLFFDTWKFQTGQQAARFSPTRLKRTR